LKRENGLIAAFITSLIGGVLIFLGGPVQQGIVFGPGMSMLEFGFGMMGLFGMMLGGVVKQPLC
jgi:hypothetical protein